MKAKKFVKKLEKFKTSQREVWLSFWGIGKAYPVERCSRFAGCLELGTGLKPLTAKELYDRISSISYDWDESVIISGTLYTARPVRIAASPVDDKLVIFIEA